MLQDQYRALMQYSIPKECHVDKPPAKNTQDWHCVKVRITRLLFHGILRSRIVHNCYTFVPYSVEHTISSGVRHASSVPPHERKARKAGKVATKSARIPRTPCFYGD